MGKNIWDMLQTPAAPAPTQPAAPAQPQASDIMGKFFGGIAAINQAHPQYAAANSVQNQMGNWDNMDRGAQLALLQQAAQAGMISKEDHAKAILNNVKSDAPAIAPLNPVEQFVGGAANTAQKVWNTGEAAATGVIGALSNDKNVKQAAIDQRKDIFNNRKTVTGAPGTYFDNYDQAMNTNGQTLNNTIAPASRAISDIAPWVIPYGKFAKLAEPLVAPVAKYAGGGIAGMIAGKGAQYAAESAMAAPALAASSAVGQFGQTGTFTPDQALQSLKDGATNSLMVGGGHAAGNILGAGAKATARGAQAASDLIQNNLNEIRQQPNWNTSGHAQPGALLPEDKQLIHETAAQYPSADAYIKQAVDTAWADNKKGAGTSIVQNHLDEQGVGSDAFQGTRISENNPYYRSVFDETGRAPTKTKITQDITDFLNGKDNAAKYLLHPDERAVVDLLRERDNHRGAIEKSDAPVQHELDGMPLKPDILPEGKSPNTINGKQYKSKTLDPVRQQAVESPEFKLKSRIGQQLALAKDELNSHMDKQRAYDNKMRRLRTRGRSEEAVAAYDPRIHQREATLRNNVHQLSEHYGLASKAFNDKFPTANFDSHANARKNAAKVISRRAQQKLDAEQESYLSQPQNSYTLDKPKLTIKQKSPAPAPPQKTVSIKQAPTKATDQAFADTFGVPKETVDTNFTQKEATTERAAEEATPKTDKQRHLDGETAIFASLRNHETIEQAMKAYQEHTGASEAEARAAVDHVADTGAAMGGEEAVLKRNPLWQGLKNTFGHTERTDEGARLKAQSLHDAYTESLHTALKLGKELSDHDKSLLRQVEHPDVTHEDIIKQAEDPGRMKQTLDAMREFYDTDHALAAITGEFRPYRKNFIAHVFESDHNDPTMSDAELQQGSGHQEKRVFQTYDEAAQHDYQPKYGNALQDMAHHYMANAGRYRANAFFNDMSHLHPGEIATDSNAQKGGETFVQSKLFGNQGRKIFMSPRLADEVNHFAQPTRSIAGGALAKTLRGTMKGYDAFNRASKQILLSGGGFHLLNTGLYAITHPIALTEHILGTDGRYARTANERRLAGLTSDSAHMSGDFTSGGSRSDATYDKMIQKAANRTSGGTKVVRAGKGIANITHKITFDIGIKHFKESIFDRATKGLDLTNPKDLAQARKIAGTINDFFGGINRLSSGTISPTVFRHLSRFILAPDFLEGQLRALGRTVVGAGKMAVFRADRADRLAVQTMVGRLVLVAGTATLWNTLKNPENRQWDGAAIFQDFLNNLLVPEIQTSIQNPKNNQYKSISLPSTPVNLIAGAVKPMFNGDPDPLSGIKHEAVSRTSAGGKLVASLATNQDYYGNPLYGTGVDGKPISTGRAAMNVGSQLLPIPGASAMSSTKSGTKPVDLTQTAVAIAGGKLHNDPTDPVTIKNNQYYDALHQATANLGVNDKAAFQVINPQQKDASGNYIITPTVFDTADKAATALRFDGAMNASRQINQKLADEGQNVDPFWTSLSDDQQKAVLEHETMDLGGPQATKWMDDNKSWYTPFEKERAAFFDSLPPGDSNKPQLPADLQAPKPSDQVNQDFTDYDQLSSGADRAKFLDDHPEFQDYMDKHSQYVNNMLVAQGKYAMRSFPKPDDATNAFLKTYMAADKATQKVMRNSSPSAYQAMNLYFAAVDRYGLDKEAGTDSLLSPGQDPNADPSQKYLKDVYNLGKYDIAATKNAAGATVYSMDPEAAYQQSRASGFGPGSSSYAKYTAKRAAYAQQNRVLKAARYASKITSRSTIRVHTPSQLRRLSKVVTVGTNSHKKKGGLRVRYKKLNI